MSNRRWPRLTRDAVLFIAGLAGVFHETVFTNADRPSLLFLFGAMIGLPAFLRSDEKRNAPKPPEPPKPPTHRVRRGSA